MDAIKLRGLAKAYKEAHSKHKVALSKYDSNNNQSAANLLAAKMQLFLMLTIIEKYVLDFGNINTANPYEICPLYQLARAYQNVAVKEQTRNRSEYVKEYSDGGRIYESTNLRKAARHPNFIYYKNSELITIAADKAREAAERAKAKFYDYIIQDQQLLLE